MGKVAGGTVALLICVFSILLLVPYTTKVEKHQKSITQIDTEIENVLKLAGGATAVSAAVSLLPGDACTPISLQFAELGKYFIVILSALYFEKHFIIMSGYISFGFLIPIATVLFYIGICFSKKKMTEIGTKLIIGALLLYFMIPISVRASEMIFNNYQNKMDQTIENAQQISVVDEDEEGVEKFLSWIEEVSGTVVDYVTGLLSRFIEATAVMILTSCIIPVLVLVFLGWLLKLLFGMDLTQPNILSQVFVKKEDGLDDQVP